PKDSYWIKDINAGSAAEMSEPIFGTKFRRNVIVPHTIKKSTPKSQRITSPTRTTLPMKSPGSALKKRRIT
ncbi:MAG TPA: hypothetical protein VHO28_08965, partial [Ignavibacteriales bacterium]|nr:hypothetical protein [Ignavibacteriales bacterium]